MLKSIKWSAVVSLNICSGLLFLLLLSPVHKLDSDALLSSPFDSFSPSAELVSEVRVVLAVRNLPSRALEWLDEVKLNRRLQSATSTTIPERQRARLA
ncbi:hypothetical protein E2P81_ATG03940 [Venturia nashicola]|nr:hypothetical protein E2P81_ATG03940 [Venturia nashicola]